MRRARSANKNPHVLRKRIARDRDYMRPNEANAIIDAAGRVGRRGLRDQVLLRLIYRHGLRASEARHTKWADFDLTPGSGPKTFHVRRLKGSVDSTHSLDREEVSALRKLQKESTSPFVFVSERGGPLSPDMIARIIQRAGEAAQLGFHVHPHMLRHSTGHMLANVGTDTRLIQDFMGHASIANTVRYTKLAPARLAGVRVR
jgi:type 1 fimbriae regulatory protein FimB/type 1 fimbriae regulatory protein FimE